MSVPKDRWLGRDAGPVVRPYAMTMGRTVPASGSYAGLTDVVTAVAGWGNPADARLSRMHRRILSHCHQPTTMVDLASDLDLPVGVVRVLLGDLSQYGALRVAAPPGGHVTDERLLRNVLDALQAL